MDRESDLISLPNSLPTAWAHGGLQPKCLDDAGNSGVAAERSRKRGRKCSVSTLPLPQISCGTRLGNSSEKKPPFEAD
jgi:hypothetical protein